MASVSPILPGDDWEVKLAQGHKAPVSVFTFWRNKYRIFAEALPLIAVAVVIRIILEWSTTTALGDFDAGAAVGAVTGVAATKTGPSAGYIQIGDITSVLSGGIFLMGFMLNGVIADYKEAEKLPGEIAICLHGIEDALTWGVPLKKKEPDERYSPAAVRTALLRLTNVIFAWLGTPAEKRNDDVVHDALSEFWAYFANSMYDCGPPVAVHPTQMVTRLRLAIMRISVISSSTYLPAGYAIVELFCFTVLSLVICGRYSNQASGYGVIIGTAVLYSSMLQLLRDVDNPFEYLPIPEDVVLHGQSGSTEIDLGCLLDYRRLLSNRIANDPAGKLILQRSASRASMRSMPQAGGDDSEVAVGGASP